MSNGFEQIKSRVPAAVAQLMDAAKELISEELPEVTEVPWVNLGVIGYGIGPKKMSEHFCWIGVYQKHIILGFNYGSELPDPSKLLEGTGKRFRHFKIRTEADIRNPGLRELIREAIRDIRKRQKG